MTDPQPTDARPADGEQPLSEAELDQVAGGAAARTQNTSHLVGPAGDKPTWPH